MTSEVIRKKALISLKNQVLFENATGGAAFVVDAPVTQV